MSAARLFQVLLLASASIATAAPAGPADVAAFGRLNREFEAAYQRRDASAVAAMLTADVIISPIDAGDFAGREVVRDLLTQFFGGNEVVAYEMSPTETEVCGSTAYERGTFVWSSRPKGKAVSTERGRYSLVRRRGPDGAWRIHRYIENRLAPKP